MALAVNVIGMVLVTKCVTSYNQEDKGEAALAVNIAAKDVLSIFITNKTEHFSSKWLCRKGGK